MARAAGEAPIKGSPRNSKKILSSRIPRIGKVVFSDDASAVHCTVRDFTKTGATITMTGWLGLPSEFVLYVEPDSIRARCRVRGRKGNNIQLDFMEIEEEVRFRSHSSAANMHAVS